MSDKDGAATMLNLPFHFAIDDAMFFNFAWLGSGNAAQRITDPDRVFDLWWSAFWQQYRVGGYLNIGAAPVRVRPRLAHRHAGPFVRAHAGAAGRVVPHLRGNGAPLPEETPPQAPAM